MKWFSKYEVPEESSQSDYLSDIREKFTQFQKILEYNNQVLSKISDMEEKAQEEFLFDMNYIHSSLEEVRESVKKITNCLNELSNGKYENLIQKFKRIDNRLTSLLPGSRTISRDDLTIMYRALRRSRAWSVGSKNAHLGEIKGDLKLPVPGGFAITAWAYKTFLDHNNLQDRITKRIDSVNFRNYMDLEQISLEIQEMVREAEIPKELNDEILAASTDLIECAGAHHFSMRSSAIGEDTQFSFAGQYATFLNIRSHEIPENYKKVVASKFTPKAIYYFLSHALTESELAMSVGCVKMIDAKSSGVVYTRNPIGSGSQDLVISSIWGLGRYLVDGVISPDEIIIDRDTRTVKNVYVAEKPVKLLVHPESGTRETEIPESERKMLSISDDDIAKLTDYALQIENYYNTPQDIEWVVSNDGELFILQSRPLQVIDLTDKDSTFDASNLHVLADGGDTICPGAGGGEVFFVKSAADLPKVPLGAVLFAPRSFPGLVTVMDRVNALVAEVGGLASHMATLAREYRLPSMAGIKSLSEFKQGEEVTIDSSHGTIYAGLHHDLIEARRRTTSLFEDMIVIQLLKKILQIIAPLNLINPSAKDFTVEKCETFHDIIRFSHQKAMFEMFEKASESTSDHTISHLLKTDIPLQVRIIVLDEELQSSIKGKYIDENRFGSPPMEAFWSGVKEQGWPAHGKPSAKKGFAAIRTVRTTGAKESCFEESSYAVISRDYVTISLRLGYHFTTIEAMCTDEVSKNYIRFQHKGGGASLERRVHRVQLLQSILGCMGFINELNGDFLDSSLTYESCDSVLHKLKLLGKLTMRTKQLDMALSNDAITDWYAKDIKRQFGLSDNNSNEQD